MADLLPQLHQHAIEAAGGTCSVLLQFNPRTSYLQATSGFGLDRLPTDPWMAEPVEAAAADAALRQDEPVVIAELPRALPALGERLGTPHAVMLPLVAGTEPVGLLIVGLPHPSLDREAREGFASVGDAFVLALERARMRRDAELHQDVRGLLSGFSQSVSSALNLAAALETFCDAANRLFAADRTSVWTHDRRARELVLDASSDPAYLARGGRVPASDSLSPAAIAMRRQRAEIWPHETREDPVAPTAMITVPLKGRRRALGTLVLEGARIEAGSELDVLDRADEVGRQLSSAIENVQLLEEVLRSRRELENTFNSLADLVAVCDRRLRLVHVNQAFATRLGIAQMEILDRPLEEFVGPETSAWIASLDLTAGDLGAATAVTRQIEDPRLQGNFSVTVTTLISQQHEPMGSVVVARDITRQARLEAEQAELRHRLSQSEKLAALGQFVAGIAHELNNPLQGVLGHLELLRATGVLPKRLRRDVQLIFREADRAAKIVRNLLVFAGSRRLARRRLSVNAVLSRVIALRAGACKAAGIEVLRRYDEALPRMYGDPLLLQQAFLNIVMNAEQAVGSAGGGRIEVITSRVPGRQAALVEVRDTGPGLPPDVLPRVFEPFYTTKEVGKGTGLGLAITYGIVQEHGGHIVAANHAKGGALFSVELPLDKRGPSEADWAGR